jgi:hypothetical protein
VTLIRFFASIDASPAGIIALAHMDALREVCRPAGMPIRLLSASFANLDEKTRDAKIWARHQDLIGTPIEKTYVNIVCTTPDKWASLCSSKMVRAHYNSPEYPSGCQKNILVLTQPATGALDRANVLSRYDVILNETQATEVAAAEAWASAGDLDILRRKVNVKALREAIAPA